MMNLATHADPASDANNLVAMVPRIHIHAFCDSQQTAEAMQAASTDRRMSKAHVTVQLGGIMAAVQIYQSQAIPTRCWSNHTGAASRFCPNSASWPRSASLIPRSSSSVT